MGLKGRMHLNTFVLRGGETTNKTVNIYILLLLCVSPDSDRYYF